MSRKVRGRLFPNACVRLRPMSHYTSVFQFKFRWFVSPFLQRFSRSFSQKTEYNAFHTRVPDAMTPTVKCDTHYYKFCLAIRWPSTENVFFRSLSGFAANHVFTISRWLYASGSSGGAWQSAKRKKNKAPEKYKDGYLLLFMTFALKYARVTEITNETCNIQCESKKIPPEVFWLFFQTVGNFWTKFYTLITPFYLRWNTNFYPVICNFDEVMPY